MRFSYLSTETFSRCILFPISRKRPSHYLPPALKDQPAALDQLNRALVPLIQESGQAFLTGTLLRGTFCLRACILHDATTEADVAALLDLIRQLAPR